MSDETNAARIVFMPGIVQALRVWKSLHMHR
jgi:hypothetical protein